MPESVRELFMMTLSLKRLPFLLTFLFALVPMATAAAPPVTASGIALDAPWKVSVYTRARTHFVHPAWGWQHSERNYNVALALAKGDNLRVDTDVLFAACFLHDMAAFAPYNSGHAGMEHGDVAALASESVLRRAGFPMAKFPLVQAAERGHMYYSDPGTSPEAIVLHDADSLDFLGAVGAARMIALTGSAGPSFQGSIAQLRKFAADIPPRLITKTAKRLGAQRAHELQTFVDAVTREAAVGSSM